MGCHSVQKQCSKQLSPDGIRFPHHPEWVIDFL
jgi:hypothetical protein